MLDHQWRPGKAAIFSTAVTLRILDACAFSPLLYACETWTLKNTDADMVDTFEMK